MTKTVKLLVLVLSVALIVGCLVFASAAANSDAPFEVEGVYYDTFEEAYKACASDGTIRMNADYDHGMKVAASVSKPITLDLNGKTFRASTAYKDESANAINQLFNISADMKIVGEGTFDVATSLFAVNCGKLTITATGNGIRIITNNTPSVDGASVDYTKGFIGGQIIKVGAENVKYQTGSQKLVLRGKISVESNVLHENNNGTLFAQYSSYSFIQANNDSQIDITGADITLKRNTVSYNGGTALALDPTFVFVTSPKDDMGPVINIEKTTLTAYGSILFNFPNNTDSDGLWSRRAEINIKDSVINHNPEFYGEGYRSTRQTFYINKRSAAITLNNTKINVKGNDVFVVASVNSTTRIPCVAIKMKGCELSSDTYNSGAIFNGGISAIVEGSRIFTTNGIVSYGTTVAWAAADSDAVAALDSTAAYYAARKPAIDWLGGMGILVKNGVIFNKNWGSVASGVAPGELITNSGTNTNFTFESALVDTVEDKKTVYVVGGAFNPVIKEYYFDGAEAGYSYAVTNDTVAGQSAPTSEKIDKFPIHIADRTGKLDVLAYENGNKYLQYTFTEYNGGSTSSTYANIETGYKPNENAPMASGDARDFDYFVFDIDFTAPSGQYLHAFQIQPFLYVQTKDALKWGQRDPILINNNPHKKDGTFSLVATDSDKKVYNGWTNTHSVVKLDQTEWHHLTLVIDVDNTVNEDGTTNLSKTDYYIFLDGELVLISNDAWEGYGADDKANYKHNADTTGYGNVAFNGIRLDCYAYNPGTTEEPLNVYNNENGTVAVDNVVLREYPLSENASGNLASLISGISVDEKGVITSNPISDWNKSLFGTDYIYPDASDTAVSEPTPVATVDGVSYFDFDEAFAAIRYGSTLSLNADYVGTYELTDPCVTINKNGYTFNVSVPEDYEMTEGENGEISFTENLITEYVVRWCDADGNSLYSHIMAPGTAEPYTFTEDNTSSNGWYKTSYIPNAWSRTKNGPATDDFTVSGNTNFYPAMQIESELKGASYNMTIHTHAPVHFYLPYDMPSDVSLVSVKGSTSGGTSTTPLGSEKLRMYTIAWPGASDIATASYTVPVVYKVNHAALGEHEFTVTYTVKPLNYLASVINDAANPIEQQLYPEEAHKVVAELARYTQSVRKLVNYSSVSALDELVTAAGNRNLLVDFSSSDSLPKKHSSVSSNEELNKVFKSVTFNIDKYQSRFVVEFEESANVKSVLFNIAEGWNPYAGQYGVNYTYDLRCDARGDLTTRYGENNTGNLKTTATENVQSYNVIQPIKITVTYNDGSTAVLIYDMGLYCENMKNELTENQTNVIKSIKALGEAVAEYRFDWKKTK